MNINSKHLYETKLGFTLLEMMIVIVTIATVIGGSIYLVSVDPSDRIQTFPTEIEKLAKTSLSKAKLDKRTQYILISPGHIWLSTDPEQLKPEPDNSNLIALPTDSSIGYKRPDDSSWQWIKSTRDNTSWTFSVAGLCEEFSIIIEINNSSAEISFHPLTAAIIKP